MLRNKKYYFGVRFYHLEKTNEIWLFLVANGPSSQPTGDRGTGYELFIHNRPWAKASSSSMPNMDEIHAIILEPTVYFHHGPVCVTRGDQE